MFVFLSFALRPYTLVQVTTDAEFAEGKQLCAQLYWRWKDNQCHGYMYATLAAGTADQVSKRSSDQLIDDTNTYSLTVTHRTICNEYQCYFLQPIHFLLVSLAVVIIAVDYTTDLCVLHCRALPTKHGARLPMGPFSNESRQRMVQMWLAFFEREKYC